MSATDILRAFRYRDYRLFFGGQFISLCGTWMQTVAQSWLVYRLTGSAVLLGVVGFASQIPIFLLSPLGGALADRHNRRRILVATQSVSMVLAFILAVLTLTGAIRVWHLPVIAALLGLTNAFDVPTRQAFVVDMVGKKDLLNAIALNSTMFNSARILGPTVAGVLVATIGEGWCFMVNAVSYIAVIAALMMMSAGEPAGDRPAGSPLDGMADGFRFVWSSKPVRALILLLGLVSLMGMLYAVLMPIFADRILHGGPSALGLLMGAAGVGALCGGLVLAARRGVIGLEKWIAFSAMSFGISVALFSLSRSFWLSALMLVPAGFSMLGQMASSNTMIQAAVPDRLRGRVMAVHSMVFFGMAPFGSLLAGTLAHWLGAPAAVRIGGLACLAGALVFRLRLPSLGYARAPAGVSADMQGDRRATASNAADPSDV